MMAIDFELLLFIWISILPLYSYYNDLIQIPIMPDLMYTSEFSKMDGASSAWIKS